MKKVIVYSQPGCPPCTSAKEFLTRHGIEFEVKDISRDRQAIDELIALGSQSTPTIKVGDRVMIGFRQRELLDWLEED